MPENKARFRERRLDSYLLKDRTVKIAVRVFRTLFIVGLSYLFLFPLLYMISVALQDPETVLDPTIIYVPKVLTAKSIAAAAKAMDYVPSVILTVVISAGSTAASLASCSMAGYALARFRFFGRNIAFFLVLVMIVIPPQTLLLSSYLNFRFFDFGGLIRLLGPFLENGAINLLNTPFTFILPSVFAAGLRSGLFIFIFRQFFSGMPKDLEEAARIDGCGAFQTYARVIVPLAGSAFITVMLFSFIWHWNDLYSAGMYFTQGVQPLTVKLNALMGILRSGDAYAGSVSVYQLRTYMQAGALLTILPPLVLYLFTQKFFTESIERTGIVG